MRKRIKTAIKKWLGINEFDKQLDKLERRIIASDSRVDKLEELSLIGVDLGVSERSESYIIIASKIKGGIVKIIPMNHQHPSEIIDLMRHLENRYGVREIIKDIPRSRMFF